MIEGALYSLFPERMIAMAKQLCHVPPRTLRVVGLLSVAIGWLCVKLVRGG